MKKPENFLAFWSRYLRKINRKKNCMQARKVEERSTQTFFLPPESKTFESVEQ